MKPFILAALFVLGCVLIAIAGSRRIERTRTRWEADLARRAEVEHQDADEEWAEEVHHIAEEMAADPARTLPPPALDLTKHGPPEVALTKPRAPLPPWPVNPDEDTPHCPGEMPRLDVDLSFTRAWQRADLDDMLARADAQMLDALRRAQ